MSAKSEKARLKKIRDDAIRPYIPVDPPVISPAERAFQALRLARTTICSDLCPLDKDLLKEILALHKHAQTSSLSYLTAANGPLEQPPTCDAHDQTIATLVQTNAHLANLLKELPTTLGHLGAVLPKQDMSIVTSTGPSALPTPTPKSSIKHSANPTPIRPTRLTQTKKLFTLRPPVSPAHRNHPSRLNIEVWPRVPPQEREMGQRVVDAVNQSLRNANAPGNIAIVAVLYSMAGNPIAVAKPSCTANDLLPYYAMIAKVIFPRHERAHGRLDSQYFRIKLDRVPTKRQDQTPLSIDDIELEIGATFSKFPSLIQPLPARWLAATDKLAERRTASMVFAFTSEADARCFYEESTIFVCAMPCKTARFEERSRITTQPTHNVQEAEEPRRSQQPALPHDPNDHAMSPPTPTAPDTLAEERRIHTEKERKRKLTGDSNKGPETSRLRIAPETSD
jgi:hypothetical protein